MAEIFAAESPVYEMGKIGKHNQSSNILCTRFANNLCFKKRASRISILKIIFMTSKKAYIIMLVVV